MLPTCGFACSSRPEFISRWLRSHALLAATSLGKPVLLEEYGKKVDDRDAAAAAEATPTPAGEQAAAAAAATDAQRDVPAAVLLAGGPAAMQQLDGPAAAVLLAMVGGDGAAADGPAAPPGARGAQAEAAALARNPTFGEVLELVALAVRGNGTISNSTATAARAGSSGQAAGGGAARRPPAVRSSISITGSTSEWVSNEAEEEDPGPLPVLGSLFWRLKMPVFVDGAPGDSAAQGRVTVLLCKPPSAQR